MFKWDSERKRLVHVILEWEDSHCDPSVTRNLNKEVLFEFNRSSQALNYALIVSDIIQQDLVAAIHENVLGELGLEIAYNTEVPFHSIQSDLSYWAYWSAVCLSMGTHSKFRKEKDHYKFMKSEIDHQPLTSDNVKSIQLPGQKFLHDFPKEIAMIIERELAKPSKLKEVDEPQLSLF